MRNRPRDYELWRTMRRRCYEAGRKEYPNYGGRGIRVCDRWLNSYENFIADMGPRPSRGHSLDRIDPDGDYEPGNCRWADRLIQNNNKRRHPKHLSLQELAAQAVRLANPFGVV